MLAVDNVPHVMQIITKAKNRSISIPLPSYRLASCALRALQVDVELSPFVRRSFSLKQLGTSTGCVTFAQRAQMKEDHFRTILSTEYRATTNRMLRVATNGFMESLSLTLAVMEELDVDISAE